MHSSANDELKLAQRLALSYAPGHAREAALTLMLLDNRLSAILRQKGEVMIAQIKLAWWRERLGEDPVKWPRGEPLLERLQALPIAPQKLVPLVDGWEILLEERLEEASLHQFATGRAAGWAALAGGEAANASRVAEEWALADLALNLDDEQEAERARAILHKSDARSPRLPRSLRPISVLHGLSMRSLKRGTNDLLDGPGAMLVALRIGMMGR